MSNRTIIIIGLISVAAFLGTAFFPVLYRKDTTHWGGGVECGEFDRVNIVIITPDDKENLTGPLSDENIQRIFEENLNYLFKDNPIAKFSHNPSLYKFYHYKMEGMFGTKKLEDTKFSDSDSLNIFVVLKKVKISEKEGVVFSIARYRNVRPDLMPVMIMNNQLSRTEVFLYEEDAETLNQKIEDFVRTASCNRIAID